MQLHEETRAVCTCLPEMLVAQVGAASLGQCWLLVCVKLLTNNMQVLAAFALVQLLGQQRVPRLLEAVNRNMLAIFLAANLATGLLNMRMNTLGTADWPARATVAAYTMLLCGFAELMHLSSSTRLQSGN